jgi:hypothetical protein
MPSGQLVQTETLAGAVTPVANETTLAALAATMRVYPVAIGERVSVGDGWDSDATGDDDELDIPAGTLFLHVSIDKSAFLIADTSTDDPGEVPCLYPGEQAHVIPCYGMTKLHYKNGTAGQNATVRGTAFLPTA